MDTIVLQRRSQSPSVAEAAINEGYRQLVARVFLVACLDCETGAREDAVQSLAWLASDCARTWAAYLLDASQEVEPGLAALTRRYWGRVRQRFAGVTVEELEKVEGE